MQLLVVEQLVLVVAVVVEKLVLEVVEQLVLVVVVVFELLVRGVVEQAACVRCLRDDHYSEFLEFYWR